MTKINLRIVTFLSYEGDEKEIKELVADFCESLLARGFGNDIEDSSTQLKSIIVVRENIEVLEMPPEDFFQSELEGGLMTVIPSELPQGIDVVDEASKEVATGEGMPEPYEGEDGA